MDEPLTCIIVLAWNGWDDTEECLRSLAPVLSPSTRCIVVDNGSTDGTPDRVRGLFPTVEVIENGRNLGFPAGNNVGIRRALRTGAEYVVLLNNDTVVDRDFAGELVATARRDRSIGLVTSKIYFYDRPKVLWFAGGIFSAWSGRATHAGFGQVDRGQFDGVSRIGRPCGCALLVTRRFLEDIGLMNEDLFLYGEEIDWMLRAEARGYKCVLAPKSRVWHKVSRGSGGAKNGRHYYYVVRNTLHVLGELNSGRKKVAMVFRAPMVVMVALIGAIRLRVNFLNALENILLGARDYFRGVTGPRPA